MAIKFQLRYFCAAFLLALLNPVLSFSQPQTGLWFNSHTTNQDERTSLHITPEGGVSSGREFVLEFDMLPRLEEFSYGYVFRIIADDKVCLDMVSNMGRNILEMVLSRDHVLIERMSISDLEDFFHDEWEHVRVSVSDAGAITCTLASREHEMSSLFPDCSRLDIFFGAVHHPLFHSNDVPPFTLRDVVLRTGAEGLCHWKLGPHVGNEVYDEIRQRVARAENPVWIVDARKNWKRLFSVQLNCRHPQLAQDPSSDRFFLALPDSVMSYSADDASVHTYISRENHPICECNSQMYYDRVQKRLVCYSLNYPANSYFDFSGSQWDRTLVETWPQMSGYSMVVDTQSRNQIFFGGYADHHYNSNLMVRRPDGGILSYRDLSGMVPPRYMASMSMMPDGRLFVAGGYGSWTGSQMDVPFNMYDSFFFDPDGVSLEKGPDLKIPEGRTMVFSGSGVVHGGYVYALAFDNNHYHTKLDLVRINPSDGSVRMFSNSLDYMYSDINSMASLSISRDSTKLFAYILNSLRDDIRVVELYSLDFPPVSEEEVVQAVPKGSNLPAVMLLTILFLFVVTIVTVLLLERRRSRESDEIFDKLMNQTTQSYSRARYDISLLGGLQILNAQSEDITSLFQPMLRKMLCVFLIGSASDHKGVTSDFVDEILWPGMDKSSASNNRNVNVRKLRVLLSQMKDVTLVYSKDIWTLCLGEDVCCDFLEISKLMHDHDFATVQDRKLLVKLSKLASRGALLSDVTGEWADQFKAHYVQMLNQSLDDALKNPLCKGDALLTIRLLDAMLVQDSLDEDSIKLKCRTLYKLGKKAYARRVYDNFAAEYKRVMGTHPDFGFDDCL